MIVIDVGKNQQMGLLDAGDLNSWFTASSFWWSAFIKLRGERFWIPAREMRDLMASATEIAYSQKDG